MVQITTQCQKIVEKPKPVHRYNLSMNGCDRSDQIVTYYGNYRREYEQTLFALGAQTGPICIQRTVLEFTIQMKNFYSLCT
jgi:hypothetical protein